MRLDLKIEFMKVISEISVRYYDKLRNKVSYESYCERLTHTIKNNGLLGISQRNMISTIIDEFKSIYGMSEELSADLVCDYFVHECYVGIYSHQNAINSYFND